MLNIGPHSDESKVVVAPMAGVTDRPFRDLCREFGSYWLVSEMVTSDQRLWQSRKSRTRLAHADERGLSWVQLAGADPSMMAVAAAENVRLGADIIDINMGCPAKKVCNKAAGSALMRDESLVREILVSVVESVNVPVTLKIRLGWSREHMNADVIAAMAEESGVKLVTVHGRTRSEKFLGEADYEAIRRVRSAIKIPLLANGDITSPVQAKKVLELTSADGVMIGRAAQGRPWLPAQIDQYLKNGHHFQDPTQAEISALMARHLGDLHVYYGAHLGVRIARKHVGWTLDAIGRKSLKQRFHQIENPEEQIEYVERLEFAA